MGVHLLLCCHFLHSLHVLIMSGSMTSGCVSYHVGVFNYLFSSLLLFYNTAVKKESCKNYKTLIGDKLFF